MDDATVGRGDPYHNKLIPDDGYSFVGQGALGCRVVMSHGFDSTGGEDISSAAFNPITGDVDIASVTGRVKITVMSSPQWAPSEAEGYDAELVELIDEGEASPVEPRPVVTLNLQHCSASNTKGSTAMGRPYTNTLTPDDGYIFVRSGPSLGGVNYGGSGAEGGEGSSDASVALECMVIMDDENVTAASFDIASGEIEIEEVTGDITIIVEPRQA